jgi:LysM repeat protein
LTVAKAAHGARWPWLVGGVVLACTPMACTSGDDFGGINLPDTTPFRTTLVEVITTTTAPPTTVPASTAPGQSLAPGSTAPAGTYTVVAGDYWILIAEKVGLPLASLLAANAATTETFLTPGQVLRVPAGGIPPTTAPASTIAPESTPASPPSTGPGGTYTVVEGDYWIGIAQKLNITLEALLGANNATVETAIFPGDVLNLPG